MSKEYRSMRVGRGSYLQAGIAKGTQPEFPYRASGLLLRGVVVSTYVVDDREHPANNTGDSPVAVYCDVLSYSSMSRNRWSLIPSALVSQNNGGIHDGRVWKPRAAKIDITGDVVDLDKGTNPANLDGDHVLVGFIDDNLNQPVILRGIPHPSADTGKSGSETEGHKLKLKLVDGDPDFQKHRGAFYGISPDGDYIADLTEAYADDLNADGSEPPNPEDGSAGNFKIRLPKSAKLTVEIEGGSNLELDLKDGDAKLTLGDGAVSAMIAETFKNFWDTTVKVLFDTHIHPTALGPTSPPTAVLPPYNVAITSSKVKFPDG